MNKPLVKGAVNISAKNAFWKLVMRSNILDRFYSDLYGKLLNTGQLFRIFPQLYGNYETDKTEWKRLVDCREVGAREIRGIYESN